MNDSGDLRGVAGGDGKLGCPCGRQAPVICVMAPPIHLGAWSMVMAIIVYCTLRNNEFVICNGSTLAAVCAVDSVQQPFSTNILWCAFATVNRNWCFLSQFFLCND